ncbi:MAG TPA: LuxR C-terminal-related transcriptional regulator [Ktedonobacteraceae bacterium]|nr:LuxR C-terminal-related transcriptional regulator [Ktedonobacteraceae bacterium]
MQLFTLEELSNRLHHRLQVLAGGSTSAPERQRTLRNTLAWSYELLTDQEQWLVRCFSVFAGATVPAIETICQLLGHNSSPLDHLTSLLKKHLLLRTEVENQSRLSMLEIIREYALEKLEESGEEAAIRNAHAEYMCQFVQKEQRPERIDPEQENIRAALAWLFSQLQGPQEQMDRVLTDIYTIITSLTIYWEERGLNQEGLAMIMRFLAFIEQHSLQGKYHESYLLASKFALVLGQLEQAFSLAQVASQQANNPLMEARAFLQLGSVEAQRHHFAQAEQYLDRAIETFRFTESREELAYALFLLGDMLADKGQEYEKPYHALRESIALFYEANNIPLWGRARHHLSVLYFYHNRLEEAIDIGEQCLREVTQRGFPMPKAYLATWLAAFLLMQPNCSANINRVETLLAESLHTFELLKNRHGTSWALIHQARLAVLQGQRELAHTAYRTSLEIATEIGDIFLIYHCLDGLAEVAFPSEDAVGLFAEAAAIREAAGLALPPVYQAYQQRLTCTSHLRSHPAWVMGQQAAKKRLEAARFSLELPSSHLVLPQLTPREREVLALVAQGLQNKEIAVKLVLSPRTVEAHLRSIYEKLNINSRSAAIRIAIEMKLG